MASILENARRHGIELDKPVTLLTVGELAALFDNPPTDEPRREEEYSAPRNPLLDKEITDCCFSVRLTNVLKAAGIETVGDIVKHNARFFWRQRNFGRTSYTELMMFINDNNLQLGSRYE